jgi:hypothetical protein
VKVTPSVPRLSQLIYRRVLHSTRGPQDEIADKFAFGERFTQI